MTATLAAMEGRTFYTRHNDGCEPVLIRAGKFLLGAGKESFSSFRGLMKRVRGCYPKMSISDYFGISDDRSPEVGIFDMIEVPLVAEVKTDLKAQKTPKAPGVDLSKKNIDIVRIMKRRFKGYLNELRGYGIAFEDALQEVYRGILARNKGRGAWDPSRSSFGSYSWLVISSVLFNMKVKASRENRRERIGIVKFVDGGLAEVDVASAAVSHQWGAATVTGAEVEYIDAIEDLQGSMRAAPGSGSVHGKLAHRILPLVISGHSRGEIARIYSEKASRVGKALKFIREQAKGWGSPELVATYA